MIPAFYQIERYSQSGVYFLLQTEIVLQDEYEYDSLREGLYLSLIYQTLPFFHNRIAVLEIYTYLRCCIPGILPVLHAGTEQIRQIIVLRNAFSLLVMVSIGFQPSLEDGIENKRMHPAKKI